jgi:hypothetical protein
VDEERLEILRDVYGFNWAAVGGRERGLGRMAAAIAPDFVARLSPETGGRVVRGVQELRDFGYALEQDFAELTYMPDEFRDASGDRIVVLGRIVGRGRSSGLPLAGQFGHIWRFAGVQPNAIHAFLDQRQALEEAGLHE